MPFLSLLRSQHILLPASLYAIISLTCTQVPLLNYLGYEFSFLMALLSSILSGVFTIRLVMLQSARPPRLFNNALAINLTLLIIPFVVMATNALFIRNCSMPEGVAFFILLPVVSVLFASSVGFFCAVFFRLPKTSFFLFVALSFGYALALGYYTPALYSYNVFYGYFPGLSYDETLGLSWTLVLFRVLTLMIGGIFVWMGKLIVDSDSPRQEKTKNGRRLFRLLVQPQHRVVTIVVFVFLLVVYLFRGPLGFESPAGFIQKELGGKFQSTHFTIFYSRQSFSDDEIQWVAAEHEFRRQQILTALAVTSLRTIESYVYPSAESKKRLIGTETTNIAKPWSGQVHLAKETLFRSLKHELVHVLAAPFGSPVINASLSTGLVEGLAMAIEWDWGNRSLHHYAAAMRKFGAAPDISRLMLLTGFATHSSPVSYVLAGSFCRFLIDTYGIGKMEQLYRTVDYTALYGRPLKAVINEWQRFLETVPVQESDRDAIDVLFRRPPIFDKVCARVVAERNSEARKSFSDMNYSVASALYAESYGEGKGYDAFAGYLSSELRRGHYAILTTALDSVILRDERPGQFLPLFLPIGDAFWASGNMEMASALYARLRDADISKEHTEIAMIRVESIRNSVIGQPLLNYLLSAADDSLRIRMLDTLTRIQPASWIPRYLSGRVFLRLNRFPEALREMRSLEPGLHDTYLEAIRLKSMGAALFRLKRFQEAKMHFRRALNSLAAEAAPAEVNTWIERCDWMLENPLP